LFVERPPTESRFLIARNLEALVRKILAQINEFKNTNAVKIRGFD